MLRAQSLEAKEPEALHSPIHIRLDALSPSFLRYVAAYGSLTQKRRGYSLSRIQACYGAPNTYVCPQQPGAGLHTILFPLTHTQELNFQSSPLALARGLNKSISLILKD